MELKEIIKKWPGATNFQRVELLKALVGKYLSYDASKTKDGEVRQWLEDELKDDLEFLENKEGILVNRIKKKWKIFLENEAENNIEVFAETFMFLYKDIGIFQNIIKEHKNKNELAEFFLLKDIDENSYFDYVKSVTNQIVITFEMICFQVWFLEIFSKEEGVINFELFNSQVLLDFVRELPEH